MALGTWISDAGLLMIPIMFASTVGANASRPFSQRTGRYKHPPLVAPAVRNRGALLAMAYGSVSLSPALASALLAVVGLGVGPMFPCTTVATQNAVTRRGPSAPSAGRSPLPAGSVARS